MAHGQHQQLNMLDFANECTMLLAQIKEEFQDDLIGELEQPPEHQHPDELLSAVTTLTPLPDELLSTTITPLPDNLPIAVKEEDSSPAPLASSNNRQNFMNILERYRREVEEEKRVGKRRPDQTVASRLMKEYGGESSRRRRVGNIPGIHVGDTFISRAEMWLVGLHIQSQGGIDVMYSQQLNCDVAVSVVMMVSGTGYKDDEDLKDVVLYSGQGGATHRSGKEQDRKDQTECLGNKGLINSYGHHIPVRFIRGYKGSVANKWPHKVFYSYDGLYLVTEVRYERGVYGNMVYKFLMERMKNQDKLRLWNEPKLAITCSGERKAGKLPALGGNKDGAALALPPCSLPGLSYGARKPGGDSGSVCKKEELPFKAMDGFRHKYASLESLGSAALAADGFAVGTKMLAKPTFTAATRGRQAAQAVAESAGERERTNKVSSDQTVKHAVLKRRHGDTILPVAPSVDRSVNVSCSALLKDILERSSSKRLKNGDERFSAVHVPERAPEVSQLEPLLQNIDGLFPTVPVLPDRAFNAWLSSVRDVEMASAVPAAGPTEHADVMDFEMITQTGLELTSKTDPTKYADVMMVEKTTAAGSPIPAPVLKTAEVTSTGALALMRAKKTPTKYADFMMLEETTEAGSPVPAAVLKTAEMTSTGASAAMRAKKTPTKYADVMMLEEGSPVPVPVPGLKTAEVTSAGASAVMRAEKTLTVPSVELNRAEMTSAPVETAAEAAVERVKKTLTVPAILLKNAETTSPVPVPVETRNSAFEPAAVEKTLTVPATVLRKAVTTSTVPASVESGRSTAQATALKTEMTLKDVEMTSPVSTQSSAVKKTSTVPRVQTSSGEESIENTSPVALEPGTPGAQTPPAVKNGVKPAGHGASNNAVVGRLEADKPAVGTSPAGVISPVYTSRVGETEKENKRALKEGARSTLRRKGGFEFPSFDSLLTRR